MDPSLFQPGQRVLHTDFGEGVVVQLTSSDTAQVFFTDGERQFYTDTLRPAATRSEQIAQIRPNEQPLELIGRVDEGLYHAKHSGRDRVTMV